LDRLIQVVAKLRSPLDGCPWDLEQTQESLIPYIIEEAYEAVDAIHSQNQAEIAEELGDLLLQVVLQAQIAQENKYFSLEEVAVGIADKLIRRHPHVFGDLEVNSAEEVRHHWEKIKLEEKAQKQKSQELLSAKLKVYARSLPPLMASLKISKQAAKAGFEWENAEGVWDKFQEELMEFQDAIALGDKQHATTELGDLLFTVVNLARWYGIDPSTALQSTNNRFIQRLSVMEARCDRPLQEYSLEELETLWQSAKRELRKKKS
jgi:XTP/dITP diphosphohydrolase